MTRKTHFLECTKNPSKVGVGTFNSVGSFSQSPIAPWALAKK